MRNKQIVLAASFGGHMKSGIQRLAVTGACSCALMFGAGCGDEGGREEIVPTTFPPGGATATLTGPGGSSDTDPGGEESGEETGDEGSGTDGVDPEPMPYGPVKPLAPGIAVDSVWINAGVPVTVAAAGAHIPVAGRDGRISAGRTTLVRASWTLDAGFTPRDIEGLLTLSYPDGSHTQHTTVLSVSGPPDPSTLAGTLSWEVPAADMRAGAGYSVAFTETTGDAGPDQPRQPSLLPQDEPGDFGVEDTNDRIRIHVLPYQHNFNGCSNVAPHDAAELQLYETAMMQQYSTASIEFTVGAIVPWTAAMTDDLALLDDVTARRAADAPDDDVFYFALLHPCDAGPPSGGLAWIGFMPTDVQEPSFRAAQGVYYPEDPGFIKNTMVHEIGHNFGRDHVACSGMEADTDAAYPHPGGQIGVRGYGILDRQFREATTADFMSYCEDLFVSDYTWRATFDWLDAMTQFYAAAPPPTSEGTTVIVTVGPDGRQSVIAVPGNPPPEPAATDHTLELRTTDGALQTFTPRRREVADGRGAYALSVWVPTELLLETVEIARVSPSGRVSTPASAIRTISGP